MPSARPPAGTARTRLTSAGHIIGVGLVCFGAWLLFDARQLYQSAASSPIGVRRTVSMTITGPVARLEEALSLDRVVNAADRAVGKTGTPGGSLVGPGPRVPPAEGKPPPRQDAPTRSTAAPRGQGSGTRGTVPQGTPPSRPGQRRATPPTGLPPLAQPSAARPLTILDVGDSIGEDLGIGLGDELAAVPHVTVLQNSVGDTGLANLGYYDWLAQLPKELAQYHPQAVAVMLGGNDAQPFQAGNAVVQFGTPAWHRIYSRRVGELMSEATSTGARVVWVGLPIMGPTSGLSNADMRMENAVYAADAKAHRGVTYVASWKLFENAAGQYATYLTGPGGNLVQVRDPDGIHIDPPGGTDLLGAYVVHAMERTWHVRL